MCHIFAGQPRGDYESETRSMRLNGHSTSIRLEVSFWRVIEEIAAAQALSVPQFVSQLHDEVLELHGEAHNFTSLLRCACLIHRETRSARDRARIAAE